MKKKAIQCVETGIIYASIKEASVALNINVKSITMCVNGKRKKAGGYTFVTQGNMVTDNGNMVTELKNVINMMVTDFINYRERVLRRLDKKNGLSLFTVGNA